MRRVVSVWFPHWPTDRLQRRGGTRPDSATPLVTALHDGRKRVLAATNMAAAASGLRPGMAVAQAMALLPGLEVMEAEPEADAQALRRLTLWCHTLTPLAAPCPPDGLWLDTAGAAHLAGGEAPFLRRLLQRLARNGLHARAAAADTPGAAHAFAHHGPERITILPPGTQEQALPPLPIACLRLPPELEATLRRLGFDQVGHLARIPRPLLARRFGNLTSLRLDQAYGRVDEPIDALPPEHPLQRRLTFVEPLLTAESFQAAIPPLVERLCTEMERQGLGARQLDLLFERVDSHVEAIRLGTARPSRNPAHLSRLLIERLETIDPGLGVEAMRLVAPLAEPLQWEQQHDGANPHAIAQLVDRLVNRLGPDAVYRTAPAESDLPERMTERADPTTPSSAPPCVMPATADIHAVPHPEGLPPHTALPGRSVSPGGERAGSSTATARPAVPYVMPAHSGIYVAPHSEALPSCNVLPGRSAAPGGERDRDSAATARPAPLRVMPANTVIHVVPHPKALPCGHVSPQAGQPFDGVRDRKPPLALEQGGGEDVATRTMIPGRSATAGGALQLVPQAPAHPNRLLQRRAQRNHLRLVAQAPSTLKSNSAGMAFVAPDSGAPDSFAPGSFAPASFAPGSFAPDSVAPASFAPDPLTQEPLQLPWLPRHAPHPTAPRQTSRPWPNRLHAPARLLAPPRPIKAMAALPDAPPVAFVWRRHHRIRRAEGPERIFGEWWQTEGEAHAIRDYFIVEDEEGQRFWLFRRGNGADSRSGDLEWFLHGLF